MPWYSQQELDQLRLGDGDVFRGEATLAIAKALFQSGIAYVGGYQGSPAANLLDTMGAASAVRDELGVRFISHPNEASAAAMLGASINFRLRGAAIYKATAGSAVATDALANLASAGVTGGSVILIGGDYGEKGNTGQERTIASAMKSTMWLCEPRPDVATLVRLVEHSFELSEASRTPVMVEFRLRASHVTGTFVCKDNRKPDVPNGAYEAARSNYDRLVLPPSNYLHEREKLEQRLPAAQRYIREHGLNELFPGDADDVGIITVGGLYNTVAAGLRDLGLADACGEARIPILALNVTYPLVTEQVLDFCRDKRAVLIVEESHPAYLEQAIESILRKAGIDTNVIGKSVLPAYGQYTESVALDGLLKFIEGTLPSGLDVAAVTRHHREITDANEAVMPFDRPLPMRDSTFCTGCPERPVFSALKIAQREFGPIHVSSDIGCHTFSVFAPFEMGNTILGYGMGLASSAAVGASFGKRTLSVMGDGGFWHNGLLSGVASAVHNDQDGVLLVFDNGYTASTGGQMLPSTNKTTQRGIGEASIEQAARALGTRWVRTVRSYSVAKVMKLLREAMTTPEGGLKVIVARGECELQKQQRDYVGEQSRIAAGARAVRTRFGIDDELCTGDHSCIRLSGCPSLTVKDNPDPLKLDPVAHVSKGCVGCGLCGEVAHAAVLCPSFHRAEIVHNPHWWDRWVNRVNRAIINLLQGVHPTATP